MKMLILGVVLFSLVHLVPAASLKLRTDLIGRMGEAPWKGLFSIVVAVSIVLMVMGWKSLPREFIYELPAWADHVCGLAMLAMSILFFAPYMPNNVSRFLRHPQLTGIILWSAGHILASGQARSLVLFGGLGAWAIVEIILINRREGAWEPPAAVGFKSDFKLLLAGLGFFLLFLFIHDGAFGVSILPGQGN
jgi:uncharacterized membrane protein